MVLSNWPSISNKTKHLDTSYVFNKKITQFTFIDQNIKCKVQNVGENLSYPGLAMTF